jgi:uncharacterized protein (DUF1800 family)
MLTPLSPQAWDASKAAHLLNRAGFGGPPAEIEALQAAGFEAAVDKILNAPDDSAAFPKPDWAVPPDAMDMMEMQRKYAGLPEAERREKMQAEQRSKRQQVFELIDWWLDRMARSPNQLREKMTLFWHGHFTSSIEKVNQAYPLWQQNETLRQNALGNFGALTKAIARDPAMIFYLDTQQNHKGHPNENFARELMELFTLGIGNYSEEDIQQAARTFTCYKIDPRTMAFRTAEFERDDGEKKIFGRTGNFSADQFIDLILEKPACARHIAKKLWTFFAYDDPAPALVEQLAESLRGAKYELRPVMAEILRSAEFYSPAAIRSQVKGPIQWLVQTARELELELPRGQVVMNVLRPLGQVPFMPPNVKGWNGGRAWINASTLLMRYNMAGLLASGGGQEMMRMMTRDGGPQMAGPEGAPVRALDLAKLAPPKLREDPKVLVKALAFRLYHAELTPKEQEIFLKYLEEQAGGNSDRIVSGLLQLMMSTPEFQLT